ncbi:MAG: phosphoribosylanthranilate isomerase [Marivirga sp.]|jgi:phosphoribosylanthranilate isomerase
MALKTLVKISAINNLSDARYCAGMAVDLMGFDLNPTSGSYTNYQNFVELTGWLSGVEFVGEFMAENSREQIAEAIKTYELSTIQVSDPSQVEAFSGAEVNILFKINIDQVDKSEEVASLMHEIKDKVQYFLFESDQGIHYKAHIVNEVMELAQSYPIIMGFNVNVNTLDVLLDSSDVKGVALKGGEEIRPGYKDFDELADILEALELED